MGFLTNWIAQNITEPLQEMIINSVNATIISWLNSLVDALTAVIGQETKLADSLLSNAYIVNATHYVQGLAISLLILRLIFEGVTTYILYTSGESTNPMDLIKKAAVGVAVITSVPWIVEKTYMFATNMVDDINKITAVSQVQTLADAIQVIISASTHVTMPIISIMLIIAIIMWFIVLAQMAARSATVALLMVIGSFMAAMSDELRGLWLKAVFTQCLAMPVQVFLLRGTLACFGAMATGINMFVCALGIIGFLWVTIKAPAILQQFAMQTGIGSAMGGAAQQGGSMFLMRKMITRGA